MKKPMRSDARERRQRLLDVAAELFATQGCNAPLDAIACKAGVGQGTLYRNFADRDDLFAALIDRDLSGLEEALKGVDHVEHPFAMLEVMAENSVVNPVIFEFWNALPPDSPLLQACSQRFRNLTERGLSEAKAAGRLRKDFTSEDFCTFGFMFRAIRLGADEAERRDFKHRILNLVAEGIVPRTQEAQCLRKEI